MGCIQEVPSKRKEKNKESEHNAKKTKEIFRKAEKG
jgi:hypothetical protein